MKKLIFAAIALSLTAAAATSCAKKENDDLAKAQDCLDHVPQSDPTAADACYAYVEKYTSQQANILKCSIKMTSGGLVENKIVKAYIALKDNTQTNKTAAYMAALALDLPDPSTGYDKAVAANQFCSVSGIPGLVYLSSVIVAGSYMNKAIATLSGTGTGLDISDPASMNAAVTNLLNKCNSNPPDAACTSDLPTLGATVTTVAGSYCAQTNADQSVCSSINSTVDAAGSDPAAVGQALFCYLQNHTYNPATGVCN